MRCQTVHMEEIERDESSALLALARDGSGEAMDRLFERYSGKLLAAIRMRLGPALRAELESRDLLQDTLLRAFERFDQFRGSGSPTFLAWLNSVAESEIRAHARYHGREKRDAQRRVPLENLGAGEEAELARAIRSQTSRLSLLEEMDRVEQALDRLPEDQREVVVSRYFEELSFPEIGRRMARSSDASRMLLARAMSALVLLMEER